MLRGEACNTLCACTGCTLSLAHPWTMGLTLGPCNHLAHVLRHLRTFGAMVEGFNHYATNAVAALLQGKGEGRLRLIATYWPFDLLYSKPREATMVRALPRAICESYVWAGWTYVVSQQRPIPVCNECSTLYGVWAKEKTLILHTR